ncbi:MAG: EAL domain-containing protein [Lachnospiraceae bacterium]|nr:EAL domain-containing protein [Lachnospiraceae bacterium]
MAIRKRIAVLVGQADEYNQSRFITGLIGRAYEYDMNVCVFSMYRKYQDVENRERGESNIFKLFNPDKFDGVVFMKDTIQTVGVADEVEKRLHEEYTGPVIVIEKESEYFKSVYTDGYSSVKEIVAHLIEVHGFKKLAFLSGKEWHRHSKQRLAAFKDALVEHGIEPDDNLIVHGDFWYNSGEKCADHLMELEEGLPQAVVCANDAMAIGLCKAFEERGINVPDDIAVVSYDSTEEGQTSPKTITSAIAPTAELGVYAVDYIKSKIDGTEEPEFKIIPQMLIGESCGCHETNMPSLTIRRKEWDTDISEDGFASVNNFMREDVISQTGLMECISTIHSYAYQIKGVDSFHLCLCNPWKYLDGAIDENGDNADIGLGNVSTLHVKHDGYTDMMIHAIRYNNNRQGNHVSLTKMFPVKDILPSLDEESPYPKAYYFTPVFFEAECYGYAAVNYGQTPRCYDENYRLWLNAVCIGIESIRRNCVIESLEEKLESMRVSKFDISSTAYESLSDEEKKEYELTEKILDDNLLTYHFQPIVSVSTGKIYSYEALMRATTDKWISPLSIIKYASMQGRLKDVERGTFLNVLGIVDKNRENFGDSKVFINSIPGVKLNDSDYDKTSELLSKYSDVAVVELTEEAELTDEDLDSLKEHFKKMNVQTAVDDYGTGYSNISNLLRYMPNYVKIDRSLLSEIQNKPQKQHFVREIIEFCHDNGIMALAEGVETTEELQMVIHLGADLIQGYYTGKPSADIITRIDEKVAREVVDYYQERLDGANKHIYYAGKSNRVSLNGLVKDGCTDIVVGQDEVVFKDIAIIGTPSLKTDMHMLIEPGYSGRIELENVYFSNVKNRPCIEIEPGADVTIVLKGNNELRGSGIKVSEGAKLVFEGDGTLDLDINAPEYYGIGNDLNSRHGDIIFEQDGKISIRSNGKKGICIGSGLGGVIKVLKGHYVLRINGDMCVGIGAYSKDAVLEFDSCLVEVDLGALRCVGIGSYSGSADVSIHMSSVSCFGGGNVTIGIGTAEGENCDISMLDASVEIGMRGENSTCMGALGGRTYIDAKYVGLRLENGGSKALTFGGYNENSKVSLISADTISDVHNNIGVDTYTLPENFTLINGRKTFKVNDEEVDRKLEYK